MAVGDLAHRADVGDGHGLAAARVVRDREEDERDPLRPDLPDEGAKLLRVHVPLERGDRRGIERLLDGEVDGLPAVREDVRPRRVEVHVVRDDVAWLEGRREEDVLRRPSLMGGEEVAEPEDVAYGRLEPLEALASGVGLVTAHQGGPLVLAHGAGPGVGQQVDVDVLGAKVEHVVAGLADPGLALRATAGAGSARRP